VRGKPDVKEDCEALAATLDQAISRLVVDFASADADRLLRAAKVEVFVLSAANEKGGPGVATIETGVADGAYYGRIYILAPSKHPDPHGPGAGRTNSNEPQDAAYCRRVLVHEYSTVLLESITRGKKSGWGLFTGPTWFVQGAEEWLAVQYSTEQARSVTMPRYREMTRRQNLVTNDFGLDVQSPYVAGPVLVDFVHARYGREKFIAVLKSEEPTFGKAMRRELGVGVDEFYAEWERWLAEQE
jgi:hypothetical protein